MNVQAGHKLWDRHPHVRSREDLTFGERAADVMRNAFGSWAFVGGFLTFMAAWMVVNTVLLRHGWDRYPYILLNLALSMMAGLQGALILIAAKRADRVAAEQATAHYAETSKLDELLTSNTGIVTEIAGQTSQITSLAEQIAELREDLAPAAPAPAAKPPARQPRPRGR